MRWPFTTSGNNYDHGSLYLEPDGAWRVIAPTEPGPQPYNPGGEMVMWLSRDQGATWTKLKQLTRDSKFNHTYARRPLHALPEFYANSKHKSRPKFGTSKKGPICLQDHFDRVEFRNLKIRPLPAKEHK